MTKTKPGNFFTMFTFAKTILETCDIWDTDYNSDNWEPQFRQSLWPDLRLLTVRSQRLSNVNCQFFITSLPLFSLVLTGFHIWTICIDSFSMVFYRCTIAIYWMVFRFTIGINGSIQKNMNSNKKKHPVCTNRKNSDTHSGHRLWRAFNYGREISFVTS